MNTSHEKLRVAVAGTAFGAATQIPVFQTHPRTQVTAVSSGRAERAAQAAQEFAIPAHYTDFELMLDQQKPDLVSIAAPPEFHFPMTMAALRRGIPVLCEKPFALSVQEARQMRDAARNANVAAMVDFEFRFMPGTAYCLELVREGYVGDLRMMEFSAHFGFRAAADDYEWNWWSDAKKGGGVLGAVGSHAIDLLRQAAGAPRRVLCELKTFVPERSGRAVTSDDSCSLILEFEPGTLATIQISAAAGSIEGRVGMFGSEGQLTIPNLWETSLLGAKRKDRIGPIDVPARLQVAPEQPTLRAPFRVLVSRLVDAIDNQLPSPTPNFDDALASQIVLDAARLSHREKRWVNTPFPEFDIA